MSLGKIDIAKNINSKAQLSLSISKKFLDIFLYIISKNAKNRFVKISNFGTFYYHKSPKRIGRNPKTKKEFLINEMSKLSLKSSGNLKNLIN